MLRLLQSIFGRRAPAGRYPKDLVQRALERAVDGTDPWIRAVSGYRKRLRPAVVTAIDHVVSQVDGMAPPISLTPDAYDRESLLRTFFISHSDFRSFLENDPCLAEFRGQHPRGGAAVHGLLVMEKREKNTVGVELAGNIVMRDARQTTVSFDAHRLVDLSVNPEESRRYIMRRAYDHLLKLALKRLSAMKTERGLLEKHRALLRSKLALLQREGWGFDNGRKKPGDLSEIEAQLARIEAQLMEVGGDDKMLEAYLDVVADVLGHPRDHLWGGHERIIVDRMGIKRGEAAADAPEVTLQTIHNVEGRCLVVSLVTLDLFSV